MRVAIIDPSLFTLPYDNALANGLITIGHDVKLYGRTVGQDDNDVTNVDLIPIFYAASRKVSSMRVPRSVYLAFKGVDHVWSMAKLLRLLQHQQPDIIHFQWLPLPLVDRRFLSRFRKVAPLILTVHDTNPFNGDPSATVQSHGVSALFSEFDRLIVHTKQGISRLESFGASIDRIALLPHGKMFDSVTTLDPDPMSSDITFLMFGKIKPYKGIDILIKAFSILPEDLQQQARVRIVGKPYMDMSQLYSVIQSSGVQERISIEPRFIKDTEIPNLFGNGIVAVFPYRELEASGVLSQVLAFGRPIIASRVGIFSEVLQNGIHGCLVSPDNIDELAAAMAKMINDKLFASSCSSAVIELNNQSEDWINVAGKTAKLYAELCG